MNDLFGFAPDVVDGQAEEDYVDYAKLGRYAEFFVCAELTDFGYYAQHTDSPGFDIILTHDDGHARVQVKSSSQVSNGSYIWGLESQSGTPSNRGGSTGMGKIDKRHADILALYQRDQKKALYIPVNGKGRASISISQFKSADPLFTLQQAIKSLKGGGGVV